MDNLEVMTRRAMLQDMIYAPAMMASCLVEVYEGTKRSCCVCCWWVDVDIDLVGLGGAVPTTWSLELPEFCWEKHDGIDQFLPYACICI